jgi:hypothetical protein
MKTAGVQVIPRQGVVSGFAEWSPEGAVQDSPRRKSGVGVESD